MILVNRQTKKIIAFLITVFGVAVLFINNTAQMAELWGIQVGVQEINYIALIAVMASVWYLIFKLE